MKNALLALALFSTTACAAPSDELVIQEVIPAKPEPPPFVEWPRAELSAWAVWDRAIATAMAEKDWDKAVTLLRKTPPAEGDGVWAFATLWALIHAGRGEEGLDLFTKLDADEKIPASWRHAVKGMALSDVQPQAALAELEAVETTSSLWARAQVQRAEVLRALGREEEAWALYATLAAQPGCVPGVPQATLALALHATGDAALTHFRRGWTACPNSAQDEGFRKGLAAYKPTIAEVGARAEALQSAGRYEAALALTDAHVAQAAGAGAEACVLLAARGRAQFKRNSLTDASKTLAGVGERCASTDAALGSRSMYLLGTAQFRRGAYHEAAATFAKLAELFPTTALADDALLHGGIALQEADNLEGAQAVWARGLELYPQGDTTPEATWRLAFSHYLGGNPQKAREVAHALGAMEVSTNPVHVLAGRYWDARWAVYPDVADPRTPVDDPAVVAAAVEAWTQLLRDEPRSFYAILAYSRLVELDPQRALALERPAPQPPPESWTISRNLAEDAHFQAGFVFLRLGLVAEGLAEWKLAPDGERAGEEMAAMTEARIQAGDWLFAHDAFRQWLRTRAPSILGPDADAVLRVAYPDRYWTEVQAAVSAEYRYEPRLFHALVREESNFNAEIRSHAGAMGLSQVMPATARQTAGWMDLKLKTGDLVDPNVNLRLGARYLEAMHRQMGGSPYLALASYNAGAGRQQQWLKEWGNIPTDEYVERIPFRETRDYVKRVMGTWQVYRHTFDSTAPFYDLSAFNHYATGAPRS